MSVNCRLIPILIVPKKFQEKYIKNQHSKRLRVHVGGGGRRESTPSPLCSEVRGPTIGCARRLHRGVGPPLVSPFGLYLPLIQKTLGEHFFPRYSPLFHRLRDSKIGMIRRTCPGTLPGGELISDNFSTSMSASQMSRE